ncbi:MAG: hypothetical protein ACRELU_05240, partial [Gemmatimonadota bacterium]
MSKLPLLAMTCIFLDLIPCDLKAQETQEIEYVSPSMAFILPLEDPTCTQPDPNCEDKRNQDLSICLLECGIGDDS